MERDKNGTGLIEKLLRTDDQSEDINKLCDIVRETSFQIHKFLRSGHLEKIYESALTHRLTKMGIPVIQQHELGVFDEDGTSLGRLCVDLFVANRLIVEVKACRAVVDEHIAQLLGVSSRFSHRAWITD